MILSNYFIKKRINKLLQFPISRERRFLPLTQIRTVLVVYKAEDQEKARQCIARLKARNLAIKQCIFSDSALLSEAESPDVLQFSRKELDIWAFPKKEVQEVFKSLTADVLIDLVIEDACYPMQYLELQHTAHMKIGLKREIGDLYDFSLSLGKQRELGYIFEQMLFYLQTFRTE